ncbi:hypothetical protein C8R45DRAFT_608279 [Mycena sanguinolenta]|nr:hypothetical protein C8R45DRAFT_608279 [Mycena sanguinolenta]
MFSKSLRNFRKQSSAKKNKTITKTKTVRLRMTNPVSVPTYFAAAGKRLPAVQSGIRQQLQRSPPRLHNPRSPLYMYNFRRPPFLPQRLHTMGGWDVTVRITPVQITQSCEALQSTSTVGILESTASGTTAAGTAPPFHFHDGRDSIVCLDAVEHERIMGLIQARSHRLNPLYAKSQVDRESPSSRPRTFAAKFGSCMHASLKDLLCISIVFPCT